jgi:Sec23-binding domain of Sec16
LQKEKKGSIFITPPIIAILRDLTECIAEVSQSSFSEKSSWFGKQPTRGENFWKALETNLTKFVAGGDEASEDWAVMGNPKRSIDVQDPRFGRIASDTSLNRMSSLPDLRAQATTPVYGGLQQDARRISEAHSRYTTAASELRYTPTSRYDQTPVHAPSAPLSQDYDGGTRYTPGSRIATPELSNGGFSPRIPQETQQEIIQPPSEPFVFNAQPVEEQKVPEEPEKDEKETDKNKKGKAIQS